MSLMMTRLNLGLALVGLVLTSCSRQHGPVEKPLPLPQGAVVMPLRDELHVWAGQQRAFWLLAGDDDAPALRLLLTDGKRYVDRPWSLALELRCDPWADGLVFGSAAVRIAMEPPHPYPGNTLVLKAGRFTASSTAHPRTFGWTDILIPGGFVPAEGLDLNELAAAATFEVRWGERSAILPAPPPKVLADFTTRCGQAFQRARPL